MFEVDFASAEFSALKAGLYVHPRSYKDAMKRSDAAQWHAASLEEMKAHWANGTWEIVKLPAGAKAIPSGWVYLIKKRADGSIERYKGRLVAKGYGQRPGLDYIELYAPTVCGVAGRGGGTPTAELRVKGAAQGAGSSSSSESPPGTNTSCSTTGGCIAVETAQDPTRHSC